MDPALRVLAAAAGVALVAWTVMSAVKTVILPRATVSLITRAVFLGTRRAFRLLAPRSASYGWRDRVLSAYSPVSLLATLAAWLALTLAGFVGIFIGVDGLSWRTALELSGSSLFTLGFAQPEGLDSTLLVFTEAVIGLFLLALLITYLPSIYSAFSRRELAVTALEIRAGSPPSGRELLWRYFRLERAHLLGELWAEWEHWFVDVEETHTSLPALVFFRSPQPDHSWVTAAGAVLDGASLVLSSVELPRDVQAEFCIRAGYLSLRRIADSFRIPYDRDPSPDDPISITREEWEGVLDSFVSQGIPVKADRDRAWRDFAGWRINYDTVLLALANLTSAPYAFWSSDRAGDRSFRPRIFGATRPPRA